MVRNEGVRNGAKHRKILEENLFQSSKDLCLGRRFTFQQDNDPKHTAEAQYVNVVEWAGQSPDLSPADNLWHVPIYQATVNAAAFL